MKLVWEGCLRWWCPHQHSWVGLCCWLWHWHCRAEMRWCWLTCLRPHGKWGCSSCQTKSYGSAGIITYVSADQQTQGLGKEDLGQDAIYYIHPLVIWWLASGMDVCAATWQPACLLSIKILVMHRDTTWTGLQSGLVSCIYILQQLSSKGGMPTCIQLLWLWWWANWQQAEGVWPHWMCDRLRSSEKGRGSQHMQILTTPAW